MEYVDLVDQIWDVIEQQCHLPELSSQGAVSERKPVKTGDGAESSVDAGFGAGNGISVAAMLAMNDGALVSRDCEQ
ncbi:uncharacterized protein A4U43_C04F24350 [Asparagus officinalis]|uniref:Uncharacterized protein n=1 Tax=Asparagus officinalis TaxID=4686 RepID=A0A5P1F819_ASPOF|nr:uncharacterized protein A4U43_C04F24350 [Asparagus officinalis]